MNERGQVDGVIIITKIHCVSSSFRIRNVFEQLLRVRAEYDNFDTNKIDRNVLKIFYGA